MAEDSTLIQLTYLLSGVMRRINGKALDKTGDMRFKYMPPENRAENECGADRETAARMENAPWKTQSPSTNLCASLLRS